jgi:hypothetical protein
LDFSKGREGYPIWNRVQGIQGGLGPMNSYGSRIIGDNALKCSKPPSVAPGGFLGLRGLDFFLMVTLERSKGGRLS